jgi:hypothetical protein
MANFGGKKRRKRGVIIMPPPMPNPEVTKAPARTIPIKTNRRYGSCRPPRPWNMERKKSIAEFYDPRKVVIRAQAGCRGGS